MNGLYAIYALNLLDIILEGLLPQIRRAVCCAKCKQTRDLKFELYPCPFCKTGEYSFVYEEVPFPHELIQVPRVEFQEDEKLYRQRKQTVEAILNQNN